jgi:hypothetical protein
MTWQYYTTPHHDTVTCRFKEDKIEVEFMGSVAQKMPDRKEKRPVLHGQALT